MSDCFFFDRRLRKALESLLSTRLVLLADAARQHLLAREAFIAMKVRAIRLLAAFHDDFTCRDGLPEEELRLMVYGGMDAKLMRLVLDDLRESGITAQYAETVGLTPARPLSPMIEGNLRREAEECYCAGGIAPPTFKEAAARFPRQAPAILRGLLDRMATEELCVSSSANSFS